MAKNRARAKSLEFDLDRDHLISLWDDQDGCCALTGLKFELGATGIKGQVHPRAPSLDRITPSLGYVKGNIRLITYHMNVALSEFGVQEFENLVRAYGEIN